MKKKKTLNIQNVYDFTNSSKKIDEFKFVEEAKQICFIVRVKGIDDAEVCYKKKGKKKRKKVKDLSKKHKFSIVIAMSIMGEKLKDVAKIFYYPTDDVEQFLEIMGCKYTKPSSIHELREYCNR